MRGGRCPALRNALFIHGSLGRYCAACEPPLARGWSKIIFGQHPPLNATLPDRPVQRLTIRKIRASFLRSQNGGKPGNSQRISEVLCSNQKPRDQNLCSALYLLKN